MFVIQFRLRMEGRKSCSSSGWGADQDPSSTFSAALSHQQYGNHFWEGIMWILALTAFLFGGQGEAQRLPFDSSQQQSAGLVAAGIVWKPAGLQTASK